MGAHIGNKYAEKWTEELSLKTANELIDWIQQPVEFFYDEKGNPTKILKANLYFKYFLVQRDLYGDLIDDLCDKFPKFLELIKKAKTLQETKLNELATMGLLNPAMTIFCLKNHHGYKDKIETDLTSNGESLNIPPINITVYKS
jgi:hypothetical protein